MTMTQANIVSEGFRESDNSGETPQRVAGGLFAKGNKLSAGHRHPHARKMAQFRSAVLESVTDADIRAVVETLVSLAKAGDVGAIREVLDRTCGRAAEADLLSGIEALEVRLLKVAGAALNGEGAGYE